MADTTGAPWNLPYPEDTDLVRDGASDIEALAVATASGLSAAGGLVAVKTVLFTGTQSVSVNAGADEAITNLSITHAVANAANKLIVSLSVGAVGDSSGAARIGIAVMDGATLIGVGAADGSRVRVGAIGRFSGTSNTQIFSHHITFVYEPGDTTSRTYTARVLNAEGSTRTVFVNRNELDADGNSTPRAASSLVIQEVRV